MGSPNTQGRHCGRRRGYAVLKITTDDIGSKSPEITGALDELARQGARRMILAAPELEEDQYVQELCHLRDGFDHAMVVRNGRAEDRTVHLGPGTIHVRAPRVDDRCPAYVAPTRVRVQQQDPATGYATVSALGGSPASPVSAWDCRRETSQRRWRLSWDRKRLASQPQRSPVCWQHGKMSIGSGGNALWETATMSTSGTVFRRIWGSLPQSCGHLDQRTSTVNVVRVPGRTLDSSENNQSHRIVFRHCQSPDEED